MGSRGQHAFPAGDESDGSVEEWDTRHVDQPPHVKDLDADVPHVEDEVWMLEKAISRGDIGTIKQLLDNGMDVESRLSSDWTPLMHAVSVANCSLAKLLLDRGASANFHKDQWTVLMASVTAKAGEDKIAACVELLLSRHADPNMVERSQMSCVMLAARAGLSKVINVLVSHGAELNVQDANGYTALSVAVQYGREEAVLKLLQLGADKTIRTKSGKNPADLAEFFKHTRIAKILASASPNLDAQAFSSLEETLSKFFMTNSEQPSAKESVTRLDDLELLLHGLDLSYLTDIMSENDITWSDLLTMEKEDLEKVGITNPEDQQTLLRAVQLMQLDRVDLATVSHRGASDLGSGDLHDFLIGVKQHCLYLTEKLQDVISIFPCHPSQLVFSLDLQEAQTMCNQLLVQTKDLQKEVTCLRNLLCQKDKAGDCRQLPQPGSHSRRKAWRLIGVALSGVGAAGLTLLYRAARGKIYLQM